MYAPTIALRVQQLNRELEGAWEQLAMWVAKVRRGFQGFWGVSRGLGFSFGGF